MTRQDARHAIGRLVAWPNMDARIDGTKTILERVGQQGIVTVSYSVEHAAQRFVTYKHVSEVWTV